MMIESRINATALNPRDSVYTVSSRVPGRVINVIRSLIATQVLLKPIVSTSD
jgi:hypothetical protein